MQIGVPLRLLIIEDSEDDALLITEELRDGGYNPLVERVDTERSVADALQREWDVIIADYKLPGFTGLDALRMVRERDPDLPFIIVSGLISEDTAVEAMRSGAQDYVLKDNLKRLAPAIDRELREVRVRRERRLAENARVRSEAVLHSIVDSSSAAIYLKDVDGKFILLNSQSARILGTTKESALGHSDYDFLPKETADRHIQHDREVIETCGAHEFEEPIETSDGLHTYVSAKFPVYDATGTVFGVGGISTDVTEMIRLQRQLKEALEREQYFSLLLQRALLPAMPRIGAGYDVGAEYVPAFAGREIGGDFYDVFVVRDSHAGVLIGDVAGKGLEAAALAATTRSTIHAFVHETASPAEALSRADAVLSSPNSEDGAFVTVFLVIIDLETGAFRYSSAGHPPAMLRRQDCTVGYLECGQTPLGIGGTQAFIEHSEHLDPGDSVVLYTDGISEARIGGDLFDQSGIENAMRSQCDLDAAGSAKALLEAATAYAKGQLRDDAAVVVVTRCLDS